MKGFSNTHETSALSPGKSTPITTQRGFRPVVFVLILLVNFYIIYLSVLGSSAPEDSLDRLFEDDPGNTIQKDKDENFKWSSIKASEHLIFASCFGEFECAKLKLPLDYFNGTYPDRSISLALVKVPAKVPVTDPRYAGPVLVNPGGPGGSGTFLAKVIGKQLQTVVDSAENPNSMVTWAEKNTSSAKYFDIIGFDPRGVGETQPVATCMQDDPSNWSWMLREDSEGILGSSDAALGRLWSMNHAFGVSCLKAMEREDGPDIKQYLSTAYVARDMLELIEKHAEYVAKRSTEMVPEKSVRNGRGTAHCTRPSASAYTPGEAKLQFWGFSYGTFIGSTFAAMFPSRVGRLVLDGVVDSDEYLQHLGNNSIQDAEKVMKSFYTYCARVGFLGCRLAHPDPSPSAIEARVQGILQSLYHNPLPVSSSNGPDIVTFSDLKKEMFRALYFPGESFAPLTQLLWKLETGNGTEFAQNLRPYHVYSCPLPNGNSSTPPTPPVPSQVPMTAILCSDGDNISNTSISTFSQRLAHLQSISPTSGAIWAMHTLKCASWPIRAKYRYRGPFTGIKPANPILWIGNTADPVTPLANARKMSKGFERSRVLVEDVSGHCSISSPGACTWAYVRGYFQWGRLPEEGTVCTMEDGEMGAEEVEKIKSAKQKAGRYLRENLEFFGVAEAPRRMGLGL
ncbi:hypothetical protein GQ43DRAFT_428940 [Delitschia confertaspora ATCC 74209]|uniref:Peptidase S33 tripeptidyl aminopeptidase-like C-terminal domain-containing protein n=1 Tax=Delitschia confertaspora ATCC 74209 TaxID=1513339 RepID=A0A9P4JW17_9PLEO|nr:hypothetical protein GQ43DRAFT_428940 [Delitschia confertaspora ATCC 74209]